MTYKLRPKPFATPCHDLLFALAQLDLSQAELGLMLSAIAYMYGTPKQSQKGALIQVRTGPWIAGQRSARGDCYRALKRLVWRQVITETEKGRYILNTTYGEWRDRTGAQIFQDGSAATERMKTLSDARPFWRDTNTGNAPVKSVDNPEADGADATETGAPDGGIDHQEGCDTPPNLVGYTTNDRWDTPPNTVGYTTNQGPETAPNAHGQAGANSIIADARKKAAAEGARATLFEFARVVCMLGDSELADLQNIERAHPDAHTIQAALEKLANSKKRPTNVGGWLRALVQRIEKGERLTLPEGAITVESWARQQQRKQALRNAMQLDNTATGTTLDESTLDARKQLEHKEDAARRDAQAEREALADAFAARLRPFQDAAIDEARRGKFPMRVILDAQQWVQDGRRAWRDSYHPPATCATLAQLETIARKYLDPHVETVAVEAPARR